MGIKAFSQSEHSLYQSHDTAPGFNKYTSQAFDYKLLHPHLLTKNNHSITRRRPTRPKDKVVFKMSSTPTLFTSPCDFFILPQEIRQGIILSTYRLHEHWAIILPSTPRTLYKHAPFDLNCGRIENWVAVLRKVSRDERFVDDVDYCSERWLRDLEAQQVRRDKAAREMAEGS